MTVRKLKDYVKESTKEYKFKIKLATDEVDDCMLDCMENALERYELNSASKFDRLPLQMHPLDFPNVKNTYVHVSDISMNYPATTDFLRTLLSGVLGMSMQEVMIYCENDPRDEITDDYLERTSIDFKDNYVTKLGKEDYDGEEAEPGESHKDRLDAIKDETNAKDFNDKNSIYVSPLSPEEKSDMSMMPDGYNDHAESDKDSEFSLFGREKKRS